MPINIQELNLSESYTFHVNVRDGDSVFAGELSLNPTEITFKIKGEATQARQCNILERDIDLLKCSFMNYAFFLLDLKFRKGKGSVITHFPEFRSYFEMEFSVAYAVYMPSAAFLDSGFFSLEVKSDTIAAWVGHTNKQDKIVGRYQGHTLNDTTEDDFEEFMVDVGDGGMGVGYPISMSYSSSNFKAGIHFPPFLYYFFNEPVQAKEAVEKFHELFALFRFLIGGELKIEKILLKYLQPHIPITASLYFPKNNIQSSDDLIFFPLGHDLLYDFLGLPSLPLNLFKSYFELDGKTRQYFEKYLRYRRMVSVEERFLGYFRLLESLCYKSANHLDEQLLKKLAVKAKPYLAKYFKDNKGVNSFLKAIPRLNNSKYNTERCIVDFYKKIPSSVSGRFVYGPKDVSSICKLRNDISHANEYRVEEEEIAKQTKFCEILLVLSLLLKLNVDMNTAVAVIGRLPGFHQVSPPDPPSVISYEDMQDA